MRNRRMYDEDYGDWLYEQEKDRRLEANEDKLKVYLPAPPEEIVVI